MSEKIVTWKDFLELLEKNLLKAKKENDHIGVIYYGTLWKETRKKIDDEKEICNRS